MNLQKEKEWGYPSIPRLKKQWADSLRFRRYPPIVNVDFVGRCLPDGHFVLVSLTSKSLSNLP